MDNSSTIFLLPDDDGDITTAEVVTAYLRNGRVENVMYSIGAGYKTKSLKRIQEIANAYQSPPHAAAVIGVMSIGHMAWAVTVPEEGASPISDCKEAIEAMEQSHITRITAADAMKYLNTDICGSEPIAYYCSGDYGIQTTIFKRPLAPIAPMEVILNG